MITSNTRFDNANARLAKEVRFIFTVDGYGRVFTNWDSGVAGQFPWIAREGGLGSLSQTVQDLEGNSTLSELDVKVVDRQGLITADFPAFTFEGKKATLKTGFDGVVQADFVTLATMVIDSVYSGGETGSYVFHCIDNSRKQKDVIYLTGDDGGATSSDHPKTLTGHPMDILNSILVTELGLAPAEINSIAIAAYKTGLLAGLRMKFSLTTAPEAKQFIDLEIFKALGGYSFQNNEGKFTPFFFVPSRALSPAFTLNDRNVVGVPTPTQADLINAVTYRLNYDGQNFGLENVEVDGPSVAKYGIQGQHVIESRGAHARYQGLNYARVLGHAVNLRYALKPLVLELTALWKAVLLEPGDLVLLSHNVVPDRVLGRRGLVSEMFEVLERGWNLDDRTVGLKLLDVNWIQALSAYQIAGNAQADWPLATPAERARYMFVCDAGTGLYSDGAAGEAIY